MIYISNFNKLFKHVIKTVYITKFQLRNFWVVLLHYFTNTVIVYEVQQISNIQKKIQNNLYG